MTLVIILADGYIVKRQFENMAAAEQAQRDILRTDKRGNFFAVINGQQIPVLMWYYEEATKQ